ncbi:hypothetical protein Lal_00039867 [Lupinus albus]|nr:hypothetical protein Lal_00039867 [Lupinus albus]
MKIPDLVFSKYTRLRCTQLEEFFRGSFFPCKKSVFIENKIQKGGLQKFQRKEARDSTKKGKNPKDRLICHECGKTRHMRYQYPNYLKKVENDKKNPRDFKSKKAYIV